MIKCERCLQIGELGHYTVYEPDKFVDIKYCKGKDRNGDMVYVAERKNLAKRSGVCKTCSIEINKKNYDNGK